MAFREGVIPFPGIPGIAWTVEEALRRFILLFLAEAKPISIEIPDMNRPS